MTFPIFVDPSYQDPRSNENEADFEWDPNPADFPILAYVMDKLPTISQTLSNAAAEAFDIENPAPPAPKPHFELTERMPHLKKPELISAMRRAVTEIAQTRSVLQTIGPRPNHEVVDAARYKIAEIEAHSSRNSEELNKDYRKYKAVIALDEMHEAYGKMLTAAEKRLERLYEAAVAGVDPVVDDGPQTTEVKEEDAMTEEVVGILKEAESGKGIEMVDLAGRKLRSMPLAFWRLKSLIVLNMSCNRLEAIPGAVGELENLEELNLASNFLSTLPDSICLLSKLRGLNVSKNNITALPDSITNCRSLEDVDVSYNKLTYLPTNIGFELVHIKRLSIQMNKIRSLPTSIGWMKSLRYLDAHFNELQGLPASIGRLSGLEVLILNSNFSDMKELPETISQLINLKELDLSNNQIRCLPATFGHLLNLSKLNLDQNPLEIPPKQVVSLGVDVVKVYMNQRLADMVRADEERRMREAEEQVQEANILTRSTSWLKNMSGSVTDYLGSLGKSDADRYIHNEY
ncbi:plant intracellular Ras-group-related LRR protein 3-like [Andrographis paniculata]|uniref:plant intracellular Ras-group-related LRR protein 3-like n=1 Tax=Andrographis paniculata TaxID=175694 RepID=UPI0021E9A294|nr:plant intracellular Ras-group-related LRR protein 3-like [Andrographis paniculata]